MGNSYKVTKSDRKNVTPVDLRKVGTKELKISWDDGHQSIYPFRYLRLRCHCAMCVNEWTGEAILDPKSVVDNIEGLKVNLIGQYALGIDFSDGHSTGIYAFDHLRSICPCKDCTPQG